MTRLRHCSCILPSKQWQPSHANGPHTLSLPSCKGTRRRSRHSVAQKLMSQWSVGVSANRPKCAQIQNTKHHKTHQGLVMEETWTGTPLRDPAWMEIVTSDCSSGSLWFSLGRMVAAPACGMSSRGESETWPLYYHTIATAARKRKDPSRKSWRMKVTNCKHLKPSAVSDQRHLLDKLTLWLDRKTQCPLLSAAFASWWLIAFSNFLTTTTVNSQHKILKCLVLCFYTGITCLNIEVNEDSDFLQNIFHLDVRLESITWLNSTEIMLPFLLLYLPYFFS